MPHSTRAIIDCIFCGDIQVPSSEEDVIPRWLGDKMTHYCRVALGDVNARPRYVNALYNTTEQLIHDHEHGRIGDNAREVRIIGERPVAYKLPEVCVKCNGGWMEHIETGVRRLIPGLIEGRTKHLDPYDQLLLSMWIQKTCLAYDACQMDRFIPNEFGSGRLYANGYPLNLSQVLIGHDEGHVLEGEIRHGREARSFQVNVECPAASISFQFGKFICWAIFNMPTGEPQIIALGPVDNPRFKQIWPPSGDRIDWPTDAARVGRSAQR
jgi:hypothetical protein